MVAPHVTSRFFLAVSFRDEGAFDRRAYLAQQNIDLVATRRAAQFRIDLPSLDGWMTTRAPQTLERVTGYGLAGGLTLAFRAWELLQGDSLLVVSPGGKTISLTEEEPSADSQRIKHPLALTREKRPYPRTCGRVDSGNWTWWP